MLWRQWQVTFITENQEIWKWRSKIWVFSCQTDELMTHHQLKTDDCKKLAGNTQAWLGAVVRSRHRRQRWLKQLGHRQSVSVYNGESVLLPMIMTFWGAKQKLRNATRGEGRAYLGVTTLNVHSQIINNICHFWGAVFIEKIKLQEIFEEIFKNLYIMTTFLFLLAND